MQRCLKATFPVDSTFKYQCLALYLKVYTDRAWFWKREEWGQGFRRWDHFLRRPKVSYQQHRWDGWLTWQHHWAAAWRMALCCLVLRSVELIWDGGLSTQQLLFEYVSEVYTQGSSAPHLSPDPLVSWHILPQNKCTSGSGSGRGSKNLCGRAGR